MTSGIFKRSIPSSLSDFFIRYFTVFLWINNRLEVSKIFPWQSSKKTVSVSRTSLPAESFKRGCSIFVAVLRSVSLLSRISRQVFTKYRPWQVKTFWYGNILHAVSIFSYVKRKDEHTSSVDLWSCHVLLHRIKPFCSSQRTSSINSCGNSANGLLAASINATT